MELKLVRANPAGNITLLVLGSVPPADRADVAARLMKLPGLSAEQVGFVVAPHAGADGRLEMMGGEFCGNAARAFGLFLAGQCGGGVRELSVEMSGSSRPVAVRADCPRGAAKAKMPLPLCISDAEVGGVGCTRVDFEGITHLVVAQHAPDGALVESAARLFESEPQVGAWGVLFLDEARAFMTPAVTVRAMGFPVWESSCGSGSVAAAAALVRRVENGNAAFSLSQPGGVIEARVEKRNGRLCEVWIGGEVAIDPPVSVRV